MQLPQETRSSVGRTHLTDFFQHHAPQMSMPIAELLDYVVKGNIDQAKAILERSPLLIQERTTVTDDVVGHIYDNVTAYELALMLGDKPMWMMMRPFFDSLGERGVAMRVEQAQNVFPNGVQAAIDQQTSVDFDTVIDAIAAASVDEVEAQIQQEDTQSPLGLAIARFRENIRAQSTQQYANLKPFLSAMRLYMLDDRTDWFEEDHEDDERGTLFSRQVVEFTQSQLPEVHRLAFMDILQKVGHECDREVDMHKLYVTHLATYEYQMHCDWQSELDPKNSVQNSYYKP